MNHWIVTYWHLRERQTDLLRQAERWRLESALAARGPRAERRRRVRRAGYLGRLLHPGVSRA